jgi:hypothetical protein
MGITYGDYLIDSGYYDPEEEPMPFDAKDFDERMERAEKRGAACQTLANAKESIVAASIGACDCHTKTNNPAYHMAYCRWLKLITALDQLDDVARYLNDSIVEPAPSASPLSRPHQATGEA